MHIYTTYIFLNPTMKMVAVPSSETFTQLPHYNTVPQVTKPHSYSS